MGGILILIIWAVVILAGVGAVFGPPSLGRRPLPRKEHADYAGIDRLERELGMGKYAKTATQFDAEVEAAVHPPKPVEVPPPAVQAHGLDMPMFRDYEEYAAWMRARYPGWHG